jgi:4-hydroxy-tetrahydrodipicolinate synthase
VYSGDDGSCLALMLLGGHGVISVTANVAPRAMREMCDAALAGNLKAARAINDRLMGLHKNLFLEANPIPVKWVLQQMGLVGPGLRLPMTPLASQYHAALRDAMRQAGIVSALAPA